MTSDAINSHKNTSDIDRSIAQIVEIIQNYCVCAQEVKRSLSPVCITLKKKRLLTSTLCINLLQAIKEMNPFLALLCSKFKNNSQLPREFISINIPAFILVRDIQIQSEHVEENVRRCYELLLISAQEKVFELQAELMSLLASFRGLLNNSFRFFKRIFPEEIELRKEFFPQHSLKRNKHKQITGDVAVHELSGNSISSSLTQGHAQNEQQKEPLIISHPILTTYPDLIKQRYLQLMEIEEKKVKFSDPRHYPLSFEEQEQEIRKEIQRLEAELTMAQQGSL